jgi:hypothetical protein
VRILEKLKQIVFQPFDRSDRIPEADDREIDTDDAAAQAMSGAWYPPDYVKTDDERPRH